MDAVIPFPARPPAGRPSALRVSLLGRFEVTRGGVPVPRDAWRRRRAADVLVLLALAPGHELPREEVLRILWPGKDAASGANNLHRALYDLRQVLGGRHADVDRARALLLPGAWVDVDEFEAAVDRGDLESYRSAVALYRGDLVPDDLESPWLTARRESLRARFVEAAWPVAEAEGSPQAALVLLRRILDVQPGNEQAWRLLLRRLAESGRRADAVRQYDVCVATLRSAGLPGPSAETHELLEAIQRGVVAPRRAPEPWSGARRAVRRLFGSPEPRPLRGRESVRVLLESLLEQGHGALLLLGESGVGKTRIALEAARIAEDRGAVVLAGVGSSRPGSVLRSALDDYDGAVGIPGPSPFGGADALLRALRAIGGGRTVLLLAEDVHLADESSLNLLHLLVHHAATIPLAVVATCRDDEVVGGSPIASFVAHIGSERAVRGVRLPRLPLEATRQMVGDVVGAVVPDGLAVQIHRATDGNPFHVAQLARAFREQGRLESPSGPGEVVRARVGRHGQRVRLVLEGAAVLGMRFDFELLHGILALSGRDLLATLAGCIDARLLSEDGDGYRFRHELVRDALLESLAPERARLLHASAAEVLQAREDGPGGDGRWLTAIANHRREAGDAGGAVAPLLAAAVQASSRGGDSEAEQLLADALDCADLDGVQGELRLEVLEALGRSRLALGDLSGAGHAFREAAGMQGSETFTPVAEVRARAGRLEALSLLAGGRLDEAVALLRSVAGTLDFGEERFEADRLLALVNGHRSGIAGEASGAEGVAAEATQVAGDGDETAPPESPFDVSLALWEGDLSGRRPVGEVLAHARVARLLARERGDLEAEAVARAVEGAAFLAAGQHDLAEPALRESSGALAGMGNAQGETFALERLGALLTAAGRVDEGLATLRDGLLAAERAPLRWHGLTRIHASIAANRLAAGAVRAAEDARREASAAAAHHGSCVTCLALLATTEGAGAWTPTA